MLQALFVAFDTKHGEADWGSLCLSICLSVCLTLCLLALHLKALLFHSQQLKHRYQLWPLMRKSAMVQMEYVLFGPHLQPGLPHCRCGMIAKSIIYKH